MLQHVNWYALDTSIPALTSAWIFNHIHERLVTIRDSNTDIFPPNQYAAPAAHVQAFVNGVVATCIPDCKCWVQAITSDPELSKIRDIVTNPSKLTNKALTKINYNYHAALRKSLLVLGDDVLIYHEPLAGENGSYTRLQLVPWEFRNIIFIAFHTNPIGGHLNSYRTLHRLCHRYYWPGMYSYVKRMCAACPWWRSQTLPSLNPASWSTTSPSKPHSWLCTWTRIWLVTGFDPSWISL